MQSALDSGIAYAATRERCDSPVAAQHMMAARITEMAVLTEAARLMCQRSLSLMDAGLPCETDVRMAKWFALETGLRVCDQAERLRGDHGNDPELDLRRYASELAGFPIPECATEAESLTIARELTASLLH